MSADSASVHRAGRRALTRQSPMDLLTDSSSGSGSNKSSLNIITPSLKYNASPSVTIALPSPKSSPSLNTQPFFKSSTVVTTPDDEACFVDFQDKRIDMIAQLPSELAMYILSLLTHHSDVLSCTLVSKTWHPLCYDSQIWKGLFEGRAKDGWKLVSNVEETWKAISRLDIMVQEEAQEIPFVPLTPTRRRGKAALVDESPLSSKSNDGDLSMQSVDFDLTRVSIQSEQGDVSAINWYTIYQARFSLTHRWSLKDSEPEPATLDPSWVTSSYTSMASSSAATPSTVHQEEINQSDPDEVSMQDHSFTLIDKLLKGHTDSIYCIRSDHRPFKLPKEIEESLQDEARKGPLYDSRTSLGIGSYGKILSGSRDCTIKIWDGDSGICFHTLKGHSGSVLCLEYDDKFLFSGSSDKSVLVWDLKTMQDGTAPTILKRLRGHRSPILDLSINEKWLLTCGKDETVRIYDRTQDYQLTRIYTSHNGPVNAVELTRSPVNGKTRAMTVSGEGGAHLWDVETGALVRNFVGHQNGLACVKLLDNLVIAGSNDMTIRVWNAETGQCLCVCRQHDGLVRAIGFDPRRKLILSGGYDGKVKIFNIGRELHPDAVLASEGNSLQPFWDIESQFKTRVFDVQMDGTRILCCGEDEHICVRDFGRGNPLMRLFA